MLMTGELAKMLADVVEALGGEADVEKPAPRPAEDAPAKGDEPVRAQRPVTGEGLAAVPPGDGSADDPLYAQAVDLVRTQQRASVSLLQRHLRIGYNQAARLIDAMEIAGVVSVAASNGDRTVLATPGVAA